MENRRLTIVCSNQWTAEYGRFLEMLIALGGGEITTEVTGSEEFLAQNALTGNRESGNSRVMYIGYGDASKSIIDTTAPSYKRNGLRYGQAGREAFARVSRGALDHEDYEKVLNLYAEYADRFQQKTGYELKKLHWIKRNAIRDDAQIDAGVRIAGIVTGAAFFVTPLPPLVKKPASVFVKIAMQAAGNKLKQSKNRKWAKRKRREQQYLCLMLVWYMDEFHKFMEL